MNRRSFFKLLAGSAAVAATWSSQAQEEHERAGGKSKRSVPEEARVDINRATVDDLLKVPGMTRTWAQRIVRFRPYRSKADLLEQGVVPGSLYQRIRDYVVAHRIDKSSRETDAPAQ